MITEVHCPSCHHRARWDLGGEAPAALQELIEGGSRQPPVPSALATWRIWMRSLRGEIGPVVGGCPRCGQPVVADDRAAPASPPWTLPTPIGQVVIGADGATLDGVSTPVDTIDAKLEAALGPRLRPSDILAIRNLFGLAFLTILGTVALLWVFAAMFLIRFVIAVGVQDNVSIPLPP